MEETETTLQTVSTGEHRLSQSKGERLQIAASNDQAVRSEDTLKIKERGETEIGDGADSDLSAERQETDSRRVVVCGLSGAFVQAVV